MLERLVGLETEYVLRVRPRRGQARMPNRALFDGLLASLRRKVPVAPAIVGEHCWFLANGGGLRFERIPFYGILPSSGFIEGSTPECRDPREVLRYQRAQDVLLSRQAAASGGTSADVALLKCSHDGDGHCFGSHENYEATIAAGIGLWVWRLTLRPVLLILFMSLIIADMAAIYLIVLLCVPVVVAGWLCGLRPGRVYAAMVAKVLSVCRTPVQIIGSAYVSLTAFRRLRRQLLPFLISRTIICGPGMVKRDGRFVLSPRADDLRSICGMTAAGWRSVFYFCHVLKGIVEILSLDVTSFCRLFQRRQRLQITIADSNMAQHAEFLKVGTTMLVLDVIEAGALGEPPRLRRPLRALRSISSDPELRQTIPLADGRRLSALEIQRYYLNACRRFVGDRSPADPQAQEVLDLWTETLDALAHDRSRLVGKLDWVTKRYLLDQLGTDASIDDRRKLDMRYHELSPNGYYLRLEAAGIAPTIAEPEDVLAAIDTPPEGSPAAARGGLIRAYARTRPGLRASWSSVMIPTGSGARVIRLDGR
jgi:proteasome accessory factor A